MVKLEICHIAPLAAPAPEEEAQWLPEAAARIEAEEAWQIPDEGKATTAGCGLR